MKMSFGGNEMLVQIGFHVQELVAALQYGMLRLSDNDQWAVILYLNRDPAQNIYISHSRECTGVTNKDATMAASHYVLQ